MARCDDCIVIADEAADGQPALGGQHADHQRRRPVPPAHGDRDQPRRRRRLGRRGVPGRGPATTRSRTWSGRPSRRPPRAHRPRTRQPLPGADQAGRRSAWPPRRGAGWDDPAAGDRDRGVRRGSPATLGERVRRRAVGRAAAVRVRRARRDHARSWAPRAGLRLRHDQPTGQGGDQRQVAPTWPGRPGPGSGTRDFTDVDVAGLAAGLRARLGWASAAAWSCRPAGTRRCCRRAPWPTCSSTCTGRPGPGTRWTGGRCSAGRRRHPGRRAARPSLPRDAAQRSARARAGMRAVRDRARVAARTPRCSTTGWRWGRPTGSRTASWPRCIQTRHSAGAVRAAGHPGDRQPDPGRPAGRHGHAG